MSGTLLISLLALSWTAPSTTKELPSWFITCKENDRMLVSCLKKLFATLKPQLAGGIDFLNIPPVEPLVVPIVQMEEARENMTYKAKIRDLRVFGVSTYSVKNIQVNIDEGVMRVRLEMPLVRLVGEYEVKGRFFNKPVDGFGKFSTNFSDFQASVMVEAEVTKDNGNEYFSIEDTQVKIETSRAKGYFTNTMKGSKDKFMWTNSFLRSSALDLVREVRPAIEVLIAMLVGDIGSKIPTFTPYFFVRT